jgi:hypothetical protein
VSPQHGNDNWETDGSCYRSLSAHINRSPPGEYQASKCPMVPDINVEYGMAVEVAESISKVSHLPFIIWVCVTDDEAHIGNTAGIFCLSPPNTLLGGC